MLLQTERTEGVIEQSTLFNCHKDGALKPEDRELCVGWLIHQREHRVPSLALRMRLLSRPDEQRQFKTASPDGELFGSVQELYDANIARDKELNPARYPQRKKGKKVLP